MKKLVFKRRKINLLLTSCLIFIISSCEIVHETTFKEDGSGEYSIAFDMAGLANMGEGSGESMYQEQIDTLFKFSEILEMQKDSIATLSAEDQAKVKQLEDFSLYMNVDSVAKKFEVKINYDFDDFSDLKSFADKIKDQNVDGLGLNTGQSDDEKTEDFYEFNQFFDLTLNKELFSAKLSSKGLALSGADQSKATEEEDPTSAFMKIKVRYNFPYEIANVNNENAVVTSDNRGIEILGDFTNMTENPKHFEVDVKFK